MYTISGILYRPLFRGPQCRDSFWAALNESRHSGPTLQGSNQIYNFAPAVAKNSEDQIFRYLSKLMTSSYTCYKLQQHFKTFENIWKQLLWPYQYIHIYLFISLLVSFRHMDCHNMHIYKISWQHDIMDIFTLVSKIWHRKYKSNIDISF